MINFSQYLISSKRSIFLAAFLFVFAMGCSAPEKIEAFENIDVAKESKERSKELKQLVTWMSGSFSSKMQAAKDSSFYPIDLHMTPFKQVGNTHYLYVEQALGSTPRKPYRQRVYEVKALPDGSFSSTIYLINNEKDFIGSHENPAKLERLSLDSLQLKTGCAVILQWSNEKSYYFGSTGDKTCLSDFRGAIYTSSEVEISESQVLSWDRGWNNDGKQVWGAEKSGYIFRKM